jgi:hypothetical protein
MQSNDKGFSLRRLYLLTRADLALFRGNIFVVLATFYALLLLANVISSNNIFTVDLRPTALFLLLYFGGIIVSSLAFKNLHYPERSYFYLMLPASNVEKFLVRLILTAIIFPIAVLISYAIFYWILGAVLYIFTGKFYFVNILFSGVAWGMIGSYIFVQSVFLLGSSYFKKYSLIKTVLLISCCALALFILLSVLAKLFLQNLFVTDFISFSDITVMGVHVYKVFFAFLSVVLAPFCWFVTYLRLKEIEVR